MAATLNDIPAGATAIVALGTVKKHVPGNQYEKWIRVTGDASYPTGGYPITAANCGFSIQINRVNIANYWPGAVTAGNIPFWNTVTQKLMWIVAATGVELANASSITDAFVDLEISGT